MNPLRTLLAASLLLAFGATLLFPALAAGQQEEPGFVRLVVNDGRAVEVFPAFVDDLERPYLEFDTLLTALEVPVRYDASLGAALGFLPDGTTRFELSPSRGRVLVGETAHPLRAEHYRVIDQRLYVLYSEVPRWLPVRVEWSVQAYQVRIRTDYPLPSLQRERREAQRQALALARADAPTAAQLEREVPWFDPGMFQLDAIARGGAGNPDELVLGLSGVHRFLRGDLEYAVSAAHRDGETYSPQLDFARLTYYDPLRTWQAQLGDTYSGFSPLVLDTLSLRGGSFHTGGRQLGFGRTALIGVAPPGSEVDLYRQGVLLDFTTADAQGFYRFESVPLALNANVFELHIFTPQGRKLVEFREVAAQEQMLGAGRMASAGAVGRGDQGVGRFDVLGSEVRYGLFPALTVGGYVLSLRNYVAGYETIAEQDIVGTALLGRPAPWLVLLGEYAQDTRAEGAGSRLGAFLAFQAVSLELEQRRYSQDFAPPKRTRSTAFSQPDRADAVTSLQARTRALDVNLELRGTLSDFGAARQLTETQLRADRRFASRFSAFTTLRQERAREPGFSTGGFDELALLTTYRLTTLERLEGAVLERASVAGPRTSEVRASWLRNSLAGSPWSWELSYLARSPEDDLAVAALGYLLPYNLRASGRVQSDGAWLVQLEYTAPFRVTGQGLEHLPEGTFGRAGLEGDVYVDANLNGVRDAGEPGVSDIRLLAPGLSRLQTDASGHLRGWGLPATGPVTVDLDLLTTDALYTPAQRRLHLAPRPGELLRADIALVPSSGMDGVLRHAGAEAVSPAEGLVLVLRAADGSEAARALVEWDGAFIFEQVPPGAYTLEADAAGFAERGLALRPERREVVFPPSKDPAWLTGVELRVERTARAP